MAALCLGMIVVAASAAARTQTTGSLVREGCTGSGPGCTALPAPGQAGNFAFLDGLAVSPDGRSIYVTSGSGGAIYHFQRRGSGKPVYENCIAGTHAGYGHSCSQTAAGLSHGAGWIALSPDGRSLYVSSIGSDLAHFERDPQTGNLTPHGCVGSVTSNISHCGKTAKGIKITEAVSVSPDGHSVYVSAAAHQGTLAVFSRGTHGGRLTFQQCIGNSLSGNGAGCSQTGSGLNGLQPLVIAPGGGDAYVGGNTGLAHFSRHPNGTLTYDGCISEAGSSFDQCSKHAPGLAGGNPGVSLALSPDGGSLYAVGGPNSNAVSRFKRGTGGSLTDEGCVGAHGDNESGCSKTARGLLFPYQPLVSGDGKSLYVLTEGASTYPGAGGMVAFRRSSQGHLSFQTCFGKPAHCPRSGHGFGDVPDFPTQQIAISPGGDSLYVLKNAGNRSARGALLWFRRGT